MLRRRSSATGNSSWWKIPFVDGQRYGTSERAASHALKFGKARLTPLFDRRLALETILAPVEWICWRMAESSLPRRIHAGGRDAEGSGPGRRSGPRRPFCVARRARRSTSAASQRTWRPSRRQRGRGASRFSVIHPRPCQQGGPSVHSAQRTPRRRFQWVGSPLAACRT